MSNRLQRERGELRWVRNSWRRTICRLDGWQKLWKLYSNIGERCTNFFLFSFCTQWRWICRALHFFETEYFTFISSLSWDVIPSFSKKKTTAEQEKKKETRCVHSVVSNHLFLINTQELAFFCFSGCRDDEKKKSVSDLNNKESLSCDVLKGVAVQPNEAGLVGSHDTRNRAIASWPLSAWLNYWPPPLLRIPRIAQHILLPCMLLDLIAAYLFFSLFCSI